jgi:hypothetical protein
MHHLLKERIAAIQKIAIAHYEAGAGMANAAIGAEREVFVQELMQKIFPNAYRFSSGEIIDRNSQRSGQVDLALEFPNEPTFPSPVANERLMFAESVIVVFEIKSSWRQIDQVISKTKMVKALYRDIKWTMSLDDNEGDPRFPADALELEKRIPVIGVFYNGPVNYDTVKDTYHKLGANEQPTALLTLDHGHFIYNGTELTGPDGVFGMLCLLSEMANKTAISNSSIAVYL